MKTPVDDMTALLLALPPGKTMWMRTRGVSMAPLLRTHDSIRILRCDEENLQPGDIAVLQDAKGLLRAHLVKRVTPLLTSTFSGMPDEAGLRVVGKATAYQRGAQVVELSKQKRWLLRLGSFLWATAMAARRGFAKTAVGHWALGSKTKSLRNAWWGPVNFRHLRTDERGTLIALLPIHVAQTHDDISALLPPVGKTAVVVSRAKIVGIACATAGGELKYLNVTPWGRGLGWEKRLLEEIDAGPNTRHNPPQ